MDPQTLTDWIDTWATQRPNDDAYIFYANTKDEPNRLTYYELQRKAQALAQELKLYAQPGERAVLLYPSGLEFVIALYACWYAGVIAAPCQVPMNASGADKLTAIIDNCEPTFILSTSATQAQIARSQTTQWAQAHPLMQAFSQNDINLPTNSQWLNTDALAHSTSTLTITPFTADETALLQYTSGSTGTAKGVMLTQHNLIQNIQLLEHLYQREYSSRYIVSWLPLTHDMGLIGAMLHTTHGGGCLVFTSPQQFARRPWFWLTLMSRYQSEGTGAPPFGYALCAHRLKTEHLENLGLSDWQYAMCGAEPIDPKVLRQFRNTLAPLGFHDDIFCPAYGLAEATLLVSFNQGLETGQTIQTQNLVNCGKPLQSVCIVDPETHQPVKTGEPGEIWITGPCVGQGYWNQPELTTATFHAHLTDSKDNRYYLRTGDMGVMENDALFIVGRRKESIIINGSNYYPAEIEPVIQQAHPALTQQTCIAFSASEADAPLVLLCELNKQTPDTEHRAIIQAIATALYQHSQIRATAIGLLPRSSLPRTTSGKPQRLTCKQALQTNCLRTLFPDLIWHDTQPSTAHA